MSDRNINNPLILAVTGSVRTGSINHKIIDWLKLHYTCAATIESFDAVGTLPPFQPGTSYSQLPESVNRWLKKIQQADGVLFATPEYVFSLPGMLKNALEWTVASTVFTDKPVAFIVAAAGGEHAMASLSLILQTLTGRHVPPAHQLLIKGAQSKMNENGDITDTVTEESVRNLMASFISTL